jgi:4-hydroxybenzoyl-CoA reductase subunit beta
MIMENNIQETRQVYHKAKSVDDAITVAMQHADDFRYLAGGTDVVINKFQGNMIANCLIDISGIEELSKISSDGKYLRIGSLVKLDDLKKHRVISERFPALPEAAHAVATPMLRRTATIGGNVLCENRCIFYNQSEWWREAVGYCLKCDGDVCIATGGKKACFSKFVSDTAPVLICYHALIEVADKNGLSMIRLEDIYTGDGIEPRNLGKTSLIRSILLPLDSVYQCVFKKLRPRESVDYSSLTTAVSKDQHGKIKIALGGVDPKPVVIEGDSLSAGEELIKLALKKSRIIDNDFYTRPYRREMMKVFLKRSFEELAEK